MVNKAATLCLLTLVAAVGLVLTGCGTQTGLIGNATAGATDFTQLCVACHTAAAIKPFSGLITNNMGSLNAAMNGINLTNQQIADLQAYLATQ